MKRMGVEALYSKSNTSHRNAQHKIWPDLLRRMKIARANQVFAYRVAITLEAVRAVEGHSKLEAICCLKRYIAREVYCVIRQRNRQIGQVQIAI